MEMTSALKMICVEYKRAASNHKPFNSDHEAYAVLLEETDELKAEIWKKRTERDREKMKKEAAQVGAMALRYLIELC